MVGFRIPVHMHCVRSLHDALAPDLRVMYMCTYRNLPIKRPWALEVYGQKTGAGVYTENVFATGVCAYTEMGAYSEECGISSCHALAGSKQFQPMQRAYAHECCECNGRGPEG